MKIGELARRSGVNASAIRFYESRGLLGAAQRQSNGYRDYPEDAVLALGIINGLQQAGFTLAEIAGLLALDKGRDRRRVREMARLRIAVLDEEIARLQIARQSLSGLAQICAHGDDGPCPIIESFSS